MLLGLPVMELPGFTSCTCKAGGGGDCRLRGDQGGGPQHTPGKAPPCYGATRGEALNTHRGRPPPCYGATRGEALNTHRGRPPPVPLIPPPHTRTHTLERSTTPLGLRSTTPLGLRSTTPLGLTTPLSSPPYLREVNHAPGLDGLRHGAADEPEGGEGERE